MLVFGVAPWMLADMVSLELLLVSGGIIMLVVGGTFFAIATLIAGFIKRRKLRNQANQSSSVNCSEGSSV